jgi:hypothetical protein
VRCCTLVGLDREIVTKVQRVVSQVTHPWKCSRELANLKEIKKFSTFEICAIVGYYAASCCNCLRTFRDVTRIMSTVTKLVNKSSHGLYVFVNPSNCSGAHGG